MLPKSNINIKIREMKFLENLSKKLNPVQKIIIGIAVALVLLIITIAIANEMGSSYGGRIAAFDWDDTWFVWVLFIAVVGYFEYKLFGSYED